MRARWLVLLWLWLPLAAQFSDWPPMPEPAMRKLFAGDRAGFVAELRSGADKGEPVSMFYLGRAYEEMEGIEHDYAEAMKWYSAAADQGLGPAAWSAGRLFDLGRGRPQDHAEAQRWYRRALKAGFRRTALTHIYLRRLPGPEPLSLAEPPEMLKRWLPSAEEMQILRDAGVTGRLEVQGGRLGEFGLPARVVLVAEKAIEREVTLEVPEEGFVIYVQRDDRWEKLPADAKTVSRKLRIGPQEPGREDLTAVQEELEGGGTMGGAAFSWKPH